MICNIKIFAEGTRLTFDLITEIGKCHVRVMLDTENRTNKDKLPEMYHLYGNG